MRKTPKTAPTDGLRQSLHRIISSCPKCLIHCISESCRAWYTSIPNVDVYVTNANVELGTGLLEKTALTCDQGFWSSPRTCCPWRRMMPTWKLCEDSPLWPPLPSPVFSLGFSASLKARGAFPDSDIANLLRKARSSKSWLGPEIFCGQG